MLDLAICVYYNTELGITRDRVEILLRAYYEAFNRRMEELVGDIDVDQMKEEWTEFKQR